MTRTQFCDSSGLHALLAAHKRAQAEGGELLLAITAAPVLRILALTSIDRMIPNFTSLDEALAQTSANGSNGHQRADRTLPDLPHDRSRWRLGEPDGRHRPTDATIQEFGAQEPGHSPGRVVGDGHLPDRAENTSARSAASRCS
jgi:hypothetical protein